MQDDNDASSPVGLEDDAPLTHADTPLVAPSFERDGVASWSGLEPVDRAAGTATALGR
jgi:hypothetical protein